MHENFHLGTIGRTRVGLHWSVIVIVVLIASLLATGVFPDVAAGYGAGLYWTLASVTSVLFLASLLGHELSHAVVARSRGVAVDGIVLWALGGVARLNGDAPDPRSELGIALAGPAASLGFAGAFGLAAFGLDALGASLLVVAGLMWLAEMNAVLAVFNLLPAFPLDGGRVLRAGLWRRWDDRLRATDAAARVGGFLGAALIGIGILAWLLVPTFPLNGIWLAVVGWFILGASRQERRAVHVNSAFEGLLVGDAMHPVAAVAPAYATLEDLVERYMRPGHLECCPLVEFNGTICGLVSSEQLGRVSAEHWRSTKASEVAWPMTSVARIDSHAALAPLVGELSSVPSHCALVFHEGRLVGTVTRRDVEEVLRSPRVYGPNAYRPSETTSA